MDQVVIIAEAGVNHNGDMDLAKKLIEAAADAGADYVKFQTFKTELNIAPGAEKAGYQKKSTGNKESQFEMVKKLELSYEDFDLLREWCTQNGIGFLTTTFDLPTTDFMEPHLNLFKVPSGEIINYPYLKKIATKQKPVVISTGMANMDEIKSAIQILTSEGLSNIDITVLHCNTEYPTPMEDVNLKAMNTIGKELGVKIGYSDHTLGIEVPIAAVALGATVIEKHFTLDRKLPGPDHAASLEPDELKAMVQAIRNIEKAISGDGCKEPSKSEKKNIAIARKSIHTAHDLKNGHKLTEDDLIPLRPGNGISPMKWEQVVGRTLTRDMEAYQQLSENDLE